VAPSAQPAFVDWHDLAIDVEIAQDLTGHSGIVISTSIVGHLPNELVTESFSLRDIRHDASLKLAAGLVKGAGQQARRAPAVTINGTATEDQVKPYQSRSVDKVDELVIIPTPCRPRHSP
jgi:hypothetical protein